MGKHGRHLGKVGSRHTCDLWSILLLRRRLLLCQGTGIGLVSKVRQGYTGARHGNLPKVLTINSFKKGGLRLREIWEAGFSKKSGIGLREDPDRWKCVLSRSGWEDNKTINSITQWSSQVETAEVILNHIFMLEPTNTLLKTFIAAISWFSLSAKNFLFSCLSSSCILAILTSNVCLNDAICCYYLTQLSFVAFNSVSLLCRLLWVSCNVLSIFWMR